MQHSGRESTITATVLQPLNNFLQLAAEDTQCKKTVVTFTSEAIVEPGLTAKSGNMETVVKQMRPAAHMALTCDTIFTDTCGKMVEHKQVIALYAMRCFAAMQPEKFGAHMQLHGIAKKCGTRSWQRSSALGNYGGITLVIPICWLSASTLKGVCCCLVSPLPFVARNCNATATQWAAARGRLDEV